MVPVTPQRTWTPQDATRARALFEARQRRLATGPESLRQSPEPGASEATAAPDAVTTMTPEGEALDHSDKQAVIARALARARTRRAARPTN